MYQYPTYLYPIYIYPTYLYPMYLDPTLPTPYVSYTLCTSYTHAPIHMYGPMPNAPIVPYCMHMYIHPTVAFC